MLEMVLFGTEMAALTTFVGAILAETFMSNQTKAAIGLWAAQQIYDNFLKN